MKICWLCRWLLHVCNQFSLDPDNDGKWNLEWNYQGSFFFWAQIKRQQQKIPKHISGSKLGCLSMCIQVLILIAPGTCGWMGWDSWLCNHEAYCLWVGYHFQVIINTHEGEVLWRWRASPTGIRTQHHPVKGATMLSIELMRPAGTCEWIPVIY